MSTPTMLDVQNAIVGIVNNVAVGARVWDRIRIATTDEEYLRYYINDDGLCNVWFIRRIGFTSEVNEMGTLVSVTHSFELRHMRLIVDDEDPALASERLFQNDLELVRAAINVDNDLGLGNQVMHKGLSTIEGIPISASLGVNEGHMCVMGLDTVITEC